MVQIYPFRGLRYNLQKLAAEGASLDAVATPPYDVISESDQTRFYDRHPANFVRVDLNRKTPDDHAGDNPYTRAADAICQWEADKTLIPEAQPAVYAYSQSWRENGETIERKGAIVLLKLESFETGGVLPHEHTLKGPKEDRIQLMRSTLCGLSQVFMIYRDPERVLESLLYSGNAGETGDWAQATDSDGVIHRFKAVSDAETIHRLQTLFHDKALLIADGHHRYETALAYRQEVRARIRELTGHEPPDGALLSDYGMVFLTNMEDSGLKVYPTHRILYQWPQGWDQERFEAALFQRYDRVDERETFQYRRAGMTVSDAIKLRIKPEAMPTTLPPLLDRFDAALLEETVFKGIFNTTGEALKQDHLLGFYRNDSEIEALWTQNEAVCGFYLAEPSVRLVHQICESGHRMPQKSTYFYPKILSGLVIYPYRAFGTQDAHALSGVVPAEPVKPEQQAMQATFSQRPY